MGSKLNKKILFLASWYPSKENPTLGNFVKKHAEVANEVAEVDVLYAVSSNSVQKIVVQDEIVNKVRTVIVYYPKVQSQFPILKSYLKRKAFLEALKLGFKQLDRDYDFIHLNAVFPAGLFAKWIKKELSIPYFITVHWTGFLPQNPLFKNLPFILRLKYKSIFKNTESVLAVSDHLGKSLIKQGLIDKYQVINNVVSSDFFYPNKNQMESDSSTRFLHISSFSDQHKNISGMLSVFSQLQKNFKLHIITEGEEVEVWQAIERFNIPPDKCIVDSRKTAKEVGDAMRLADCLVLFSNYETFSVVLAEAWSTGIPVIYTKCGGLTEINNPDLGIQLSIGDEKALLIALIEFDRRKYSTLKISEFGKRFSSDSIRKSFRNIYH